MVGLAVLQKLNDLLGCQLLCVLLRNLYNQLQVLLHVGVQELLQCMLFAQNADLVSAITSKQEHKGSMGCNKNGFVDLHACAGLKVAMHNS